MLKSYDKSLKRNFDYLFFSPCGNTLGASGSLRLFFACASASSSHACKIGFNAIMLLCDNVRLSNLQIVLCDSAPTPGNLRFANALPTSACVTPSFVVNRPGGDDKDKAEKGEKEKRLGKKIKKQQQFFADGKFLLKVFISVYAINVQSWKVKTIYGAN